MCSALHVQRPAAGGQVAAVAAEQVVVAPAAADRGAERRVVDLEHGAGVVVEVADQAEVEDHPLRDLGRQQVVHGAQLAGLRDPLEHLDAAAQLRHAQQLLVPVRLDLALEADEVARDQLVQDLRPRARGHRQRGRAARRYSEASPSPIR